MCAARRGSWRRGKHSHLIEFFLVKTGRDLWVSNQSTFIILVPIFFDSQSFGFIPHVFGVNVYGRETEQLENDGQKFWKQSVKLAQLY